MSLRLIRVVFLNSLIVRFLSFIISNPCSYSDIPLFLYYSLSDKYLGRSRRALAWFCQTKVWTPFSESLYINEAKKLEH
jgi:hypothetical protein